MMPLGRSFFARPSLQVAPDLLGCMLVHYTSEGVLSGIIVETESYGGINDPASHAFKGKRTARNEVMWGPAGHAYIYLIYGIHLCFNVVTGQDGDPQGVFIRAVEPRLGMKIMARERNISLDRNNIRKLANGPSKLCTAFCITKDMYGTDVTSAPLFFTAGEDVDIVTSDRIGIDYAGNGANWPWRFLVKDSPYISRKA